MMSRSDSWNFSKFYFTVVSIASILGMVIAFGIALYSLAMGFIITDDEYIQGRSGYREVEQCSDPYYMPKGRAIVEQDLAEAEAGGQEVITKTPEEIAECEAEARERAITQRNFQKKEAVTGGSIWGILFAILFFTHYPRMHAVEQVVVAPPKKRSTSTRKKTTKK